MPAPSIVLEKPITWLKSKRDGERNRLMYQAVTSALTGLVPSFAEEAVYYGADFQPRQAPVDGVRLSYHSVGNVRNVWRIKETPIPYYYAIDRLGYSGWSELAIKPSLHQSPVEAMDDGLSGAFCEDLAAWLMANNLSKYRQSDVGGQLPGRFVFFPMQVMSDAVACHNRLDPITVLRAAVGYAERSGIPLVVKRHPYCRDVRVWGWLKWLSLKHRQVRLTKASITRLLPASSAVLVGNSGVGLEGLVYGKPVYAFGSSEYDLAAYPIRGSDDLAALFASELPIRHVNGYRFIHYYLTQCCFDARDPVDTQNKITHILDEAARGRWLPEDPSARSVQQEFDR